jgi:hypothetical protein
LTIASRLFCLIPFLAAPGLAPAEPAAFDLAEATLDVRVTDAGVTGPADRTSSPTAQFQTRREIADLYTGRAPIPVASRRRRVIRSR